MKKILAVSGGIDSVVMLHLFKDEEDPPIVAHFDHGIRTNSSEDAEFVVRLANQYGLKAEIKHASLGPQCGEAAARSERYRFLRDLAHRYDGVVCVAHHADDVVESIAINLIRGTGWRGLAPMSAKGIERPLLNWWKKDIYRYAAEHDLHFRQDQTNTEDSYLRNRVREKLRDYPNKPQIIELYQRQSEILAQIDAETASYCGSYNGYYPRDVAQLPQLVAREIMRAILLRSNISLTRPQLDKCLEAIANYSSGKRLSLDRNHFLAIGKYSFNVV